MTKTLAPHVLNMYERNRWERGLTLWPFEPVFLPKKHHYCNHVLGHVKLWRVRVEHIVKKRERKIKTVVILSVHTLATCYVQPDIWGFICKEREREMIIMKLLLWQQQQQQLYCHKLFLSYRVAITYVQETHTHTHSGQIARVRQQGWWWWWHVNIMQPVRLLSADNLIAFMSGSPCPRLRAELYGEHMFWWL